MQALCWFSQQSSPQLSSHGLTLLILQYILWVTIKKGGHRRGRTATKTGSVRNDGESGVEQPGEAGTLDGGAPISAANGASPSLGVTSPTQNGTTTTPDGLPPTSSPNDTEPASLIILAATPSGTSSQQGIRSAISNGVSAISAAVVPTTAASTSGGGSNGHHATGLESAAPLLPPTGSSGGGSGGEGVSVAGVDAGTTSSEGGGGGSGGEGKEKKVSEAARWLARVRAKLAEMDAERKVAADQASAREEKAAAGNRR